MKRSSVLQALDSLRNTSDEELLKEWKQIEKLGLPYVDADEFTKEAMGKFYKDTMFKMSRKGSLLHKIACL